MLTALVAAQTGSAAHKPFRSIDLSPELKNKIYTLLLVNDKPINIQSYTRPGSGSRPIAQENSIQPAILRICSQVHNEAVSILYANNTFDTWSDIALRRLLEQIGRNVKHLRQVQVRYANTKIHLQKSLVLLKPAISLQKLDIGCNARRSFGAAQLAAAMGPRVRAMHKARSRMTGYNMKYILDVIAMTPSRLYTTAELQEAGEYEKQAKELIGATPE